MSNLKEAVLIMLLLAAAFVLSGCEEDVSRRWEGPAPGVKVDDPTQPYATIRYNTAVILDKSLQDWSYKPKKFLFWETEEDRRNVGKIAVESTGSKRTPTGTLEAYAVIRNRTNYPLQIEARTTYFDQDKVPCEQPTAWQRVFLQPNAVNTYKECSTKVQEVAYYYIEIREGR
jgi:hypothetical protein